MFNSTGFEDVTSAMSSFPCGSFPRGVLSCVSNCVSPSDMGSSCCKDDTVEGRPLRSDTARPAGRRGYQQNTQVHISKCPICGTVIDPALFDGHRESCRARHRQAMRKTESHTIDVEASAEGGVSCVVCLEADACFSFVPCGHLSACASCALKLDRCPICRGRREQLLYVKSSAHKDYTCKHCRHVIHPTFFDSHREVCSLQMKSAPEQLLDSESASIPDLCIECHSSSRSVAVLPCGHFVFCENCAKKVSSCPLCLCDITSRMSVFV